jgi:hypothetical protein
MWNDDGLSELVELCGQPRELGKIRIERDDLVERGRRLVQLPALERRMGCFNPPIDPAPFRTRFKPRVSFSRDERLRRRRGRRWNASRFGYRRCFGYGRCRCYR